MRSDIAASAAVLAGERERIDALLRNGMDAAEPAGAEALRLARDRIAAAISALEDATPRFEPETVAAEPSPSHPSATSLLDRIVLIEPPTGSETFRTKLKLKASEPQASAAIAPAPTATPSADDLTRIRGIDQPLAKRLANVGVTSFAQIAAWEYNDVRRVSDALGLGRQISRQNWIEQAALRRGTGEAPVIASAVVAVSAAVIEPLRSPPAAPTMPSRTDRLSLIKGLAPSFAGALNDGGVTRWADIATWRRRDIAKWQSTLGLAARIIKDGWIEQAALLAGGHATYFARHASDGAFAALVSAPEDQPLPAPSFVPWVAAAVVADAPSPAMPVRVVAAEPIEALIEPAAIHIAPADAIDVFAVQRADEVAIEPPGAALPIDLPTALDRVAALEQELASLVANDTAAGAQPAANPDLEVAPPDAPAEPALAKLASRSQLHVEDEEFQELNVAEADVTIVPRDTSPPSAESADGSSTRALISRMKRVPPIDDVAPESYAAYRNRAEEASVEIIRPNRPATDQQPIGDDAPSEPTRRPITRLLRTLTRRD